MKAIYPQIIALFGIVIYFPGFVEESVAQVPQLQGLVGKVLVLDLPQPGLAESVQVRFKPCAGNQLKLTAKFFGKAVGIAQGLVGKVLVLDLPQPGLAESVQVRFKPCAGNQLKLTAKFFGKAVGIAYIVQDREEDNQQLFIEIDLPFLVHRVQIDGLPVLHQGRLRGDGACPVDFVQSAMQVLHDEEEETLVLAVELNEGEKNIQIRVAQSSLRYAGSSR